MATPIIVQAISDANKGITEAELETPLKVFDVNESNVDSLFIEIKESNKSLEYIMGCAELALKIRPKQTEAICTLLSRLITITKFTPSKRLSPQHKLLLIKKGIIKEDSNDLEYFNPENVKLFSEGSIEQAIKDDNVEKFISISAGADFDPQKKLKITNTDPLFFVIECSNDRNHTRTNDITYMQLMVYFGSLKCFKYALLDGSFSLEALNTFAIAGGSNEIIHLLEQNGVEFDNCLETAIKFHRYDISYWLLGNYKCEAVDPIIAIDYYNLRLFFFLLKSQQGDFHDQLSRALILSINMKNTAFTKYLVREFHVDVKEKDNKGRTALYGACITNNIELFKFLVEECNENVEGKDCSGATALTVASGKGHFEIVRYLLEECHANIDNISKIALHNACKRNDIEFIKYLGEKCGIDVNQFDKHGKTALSVAIENGNLEIVKYLIEELHAQANVVTITLLNTLIENGCNDLIKYLFEKGNLNLTINRKANFLNAIEKGNREIAKFMVAKGLINIEEKNKDGKTALNFALDKGSTDIAMYLIDEVHADVEEKDNMGRTALHNACINNNTIVAKHIIETCNPNIEAEDLYRKTALYYAIESGNTEISRFLIEECHANTETINDISLVTVCENGDGSLVKYLIDNFHFSVEEKDKKGVTLLHLAVQKNNLDLVMFLIGKCHSSFSDFDIQFSSNAIKEYISPIRDFHKACADGDIIEVKRFVEERNIYIDQIYNGTTVVNHAIKKGNIEVANYLIEHNADIKTINEMALHDAVDKNKFSLIKFLIEKCNFDVEKKDNRKRTALNIAVNNENMEMIKYLVDECHANVEEKDLNEKTALHIAVERGNIELIKYFVEVCHSNVDSKCSYGKTIFHLACVNNNLEIVKYLVERCHVNIEEKDNRNLTGLDIAIEKNNIEVERYLIDECHANVSELSRRILNKRRMVPKNI